MAQSPTETERDDTENLRCYRRGLWQALCGLEEARSTPERLLINRATLSGTRGLNSGCDGARGRQLEADFALAPRSHLCYAATKAAGLALLGICTWLNFAAQVDLMYSNEEDDRSAELQAKSGMLLSAKSSTDGHVWWRSGGRGIGGRV